MIFKAAPFRSLILQDDDIDIVQGIKYILKFHSSLKKLLRLASDKGSDFKQAEG